MLKSKKVLLLWLLITMVAFSSCANQNYSLAVFAVITTAAFVAYGDGNVTDYNDFTISSPEFVKLVSWRTSSATRQSLGIDPVTEYRVGDFMAIKCQVKRPVWDSDGTSQLESPITARVMYSKTGEVQHITFEREIYDCILPEGGLDISIQPYIAYISPVKYSCELMRLVQDSTKRELRVYPNEGTITAEIRYKNQFLTKTIDVE